MAHPPRRSRPPARSIRRFRTVGRRRVPALRGPPRLASLHRSAQGRLRSFRNYSRLAVAITALFLLMLGSDSAGMQAAEATAEAERSLGEATRAFEELLLQLVGLLPKLAFAFVIIAIAGILTRLLRPILRRLLGDWGRADAVSAMVVVVVWITALAAVVSVVAGNARALFGSVGLLGLAASWALQAPIESFAGWLVNSFRGYYRAGDRIAVGEVFGDVYRIDVLTTTLWEAGGPEKAVQGAQPTGALVTFPNFEVLRTNIINYTRDFPYVWDEVAIGIANESEPEYTMQVIGAVARAVVGAAMQSPAEAYQHLLAMESLDLEVAQEPQLYFEPAEAWTKIIVRYLVPARERRAWASRLQLRITQELSKPEHQPRIRAAYPTQRVQLDGGGAL